VTKQHLSQARVTQKFQITLPTKVRKSLGAVEPGDYILFSKEGDRIIIEVGTLRAKAPRV